MRRQRVGMASVVLLAGLTVSAQQEPPADSVVWAGNEIRVQAIVEAPSGCYTAGASQAGVPEGAPAVEDSVAITLTINHSGAEMCTQAMRPLRFTATATPGPGAQAIILYVVDSRTKRGLLRALALPPRPAARGTR